MLFTKLGYFRDMGVGEVKDYIYFVLEQHIIIFSKLNPCEYSFYAHVIQEFLF